MLQTHIRDQEEYIEDLKQAGGTEGNRRTGTDRKVPYKPCYMHDVHVHEQSST